MKPTELKIDAIRVLIMMPQLFSSSYSFSVLRVSVFMGR